MTTLTPIGDLRASLEVISGPGRGRVFEVRERPITLGREPSNEVPLKDGSVSRQHCRVEWRPNGVHLVDLESRNGTLLNGIAVSEAVLEDGDQIKVGNCVVAFHTVSTLSTREAAAYDPGTVIGDQTVVLRREESVYLRSEESAGKLPANERTVRDLDVLFSFSRAVSTLRSVDELFRKVLEAVRKVAPADRVAILLADGDSGEVSTGASWERKPGLGTKPVSRTIVSRVMNDGVALLSNDVGAEENLQQAQSLITNRVQRVLAVPLTAVDRVIGLIYLDGSEPFAVFDAALMHLLTALGSIAALAIVNARNFEWLEGENRRLEQELNIQHDMIGDGPAIREVYQFIQRVSVSEATVLVMGESGTGKELVARAIHRNSKRANRSFVAINCGAFVETLLESELFGHEKGAFTGAIAQKKGKLEVGEGGTIFLDEIGELAMPLQVKLLRVLQQREFERVGGTRTLKLDIRLVAATNRDLKAEVRAGKFREDLYYRLDVVSIKMPPLRDRREDIPLLASYFATKAGEHMGRKITGIAPKARACMLRYDWPGNVRELENAIERAVVMGAGDLILPEDLPESVLEQGVEEDQSVSALHDGVLVAKRQIITKAIEQAGGNYTEAAKALGVHPNHFFRLIRTLNLTPKRRRSAG